MDLRIVPTTPRCCQWCCALRTMPRWTLSPTSPPHSGLKSLVFKSAANRKHPLISRSQRPAFPHKAKWAAVLEGSPLRVPEACPGQPQRWGPRPKGRLGSTLSQDRKRQGPRPGADEPSRSPKGPRLSGAQRAANFIGAAATGRDRSREPSTGLSTFRPCLAQWGLDWNWNHLGSF